MSGMRGDDRQPDAMFSYVSAEQRVPTDHPLRAIRELVDEVLRDMTREFDGLYARVGRPSIPPERLSMRDCVGDLLGRPSSDVVGPPQGLCSLLLRLFQRGHCRR
jgi:hypothetical protein